MFLFHKYTQGYRQLYTDRYIIQTTKRTGDKHKEDMEMAKSEKTFSIYKVHIPTNQKYLVRRFDNFESAQRRCKGISLKTKALGDDDLYKYIVLEDH